MKPSLVFLHGGPGFKDYLEPYFKELNDSFDCHFYDQRQGPSVVLDDLIQELRDVVAPLSRPVLVGHSWGGTLAAEFAVRYPEMIRGLALMCCPLSSEQWLEYHQDLKALKLEEAPPEAIFLVPEDLEHGRDFLAQTWSTFSGETFESLKRSYINDFDITGKLNQISLKTINIYGEFDLRIPTRVAESFRRYNPAILDYRIQGAGHFPFLQETGRREIFEILRRSFLPAS